MNIAISKQKFRFNICILSPNRITRRVQRQKSKRWAVISTKVLCAIKDIGSQPSAWPQVDRSTKQPFLFSLCRFAFRYNIYIFYSARLGISEIYRYCSC